MIFDYVNISIEKLEEGTPFRKWISIFVKILGVLLLIGCIVSSIYALVSVIRIGRYLGTTAMVTGIVAGVISFPINIFMGIIIMKLFFIRADNIRKLEERTHFTILPTVVVLIRLCGETSFVALVGQGIISFLTLLIGGRGIPEYYREFLPIPGFVGGVLILIAACVLAVVLLIGSYFIAEQINLLVDMASNIKKIETKVSTEQ